MALSGNSVPARFYPFGVKGAHHVVGGLNRRLGIGELELGLPVCGLGYGKFLLCLEQIKTCLPFSLSRRGGLVVGLRRN
jgi:hypothetical protein